MPNNNDGDLEIRTGQASLRSKANGGGNLIRKCKAGTVVSVLEIKGNYFLVNVKDETGYMQTACSIIPPLMFTTNLVADFLQKATDVLHISDFTRAVQNSHEKNMSISLSEKDRRKTNTALQAILFSEKNTLH